MGTTAEQGAELAMGARFGAMRRRTLELCAGLTAEDMMVQSCAEASPAKWHLAHTAWFFESFVLREFLPGYRPFHKDFHWLFNSYYEGFAAIPEKRLRSSFSRPALEEILGYREHVDRGVERLLEMADIEAGAKAEALRRIELGVNHEEQHQELLLTDILHGFFTNPLRPVYRSGAKLESLAGNETTPLEFEQLAGGMREIGHAGTGFCFDNELGRHRVWLEPYRLARRLVTCGEFAGFMADGGYRRPELWLSAGWDAVKEKDWQAPLYWTNEGGAWSVFTLRGEFTLKELETAPVSHVSFYEADAYARWAGRRLATEFEWEAAAEGRAVEGNLLDAGRLMPAAGSELHQDEGIAQLWGDCWEWTGSAYLGYPGFRPLAGALGEYNGKFMSGQMVLRGGSCVTPSAHIRASYRNFFAPETRWQFSGIRLAF
ncbi:MAG TPA: ergothioneine biosynthesis protein EgtB [Terracidiphilus sp.]|nr:ergothioneine biosynthesis protein EgtB [Terracidiphilus sp.]HUX46298.1 ergothioneine biosynthesis protein EgtB [Terracidiphilus sp.]